MKQLFFFFLSLFVFTPTCFSMESINQVPQENQELVIQTIQNLQTTNTTTEENISTQEEQKKSLELQEPATTPNTLFNYLFKSCYIPINFDEAGEIIQDYKEKIMTQLQTKKSNDSTKEENKDNQ